MALNRKRKLGSKYVMKQMAKHINVAHINRFLLNPFILERLH